MTTATDAAAGSAPDVPTPDAPVPPIAGSDPPALPTLGPAPGPILPSDTLAVAGRKAMWIHVERLLAREPGLREPDLPDELRKYRVATRRLRAAIRMFGAAYPQRDVARVKDGLTTIARAVGAVRDLDVRVADLTRWATERGGDDLALVGPLVGAWRTQRTAFAATLARRLDGRRHRRWLASLARFVDATSDASRAASDGPPTIRDRAASRIWDAYERTRAYDAVVETADVETLHEIRIATKRLRYCLEFLADVLAPDRAWLLERLVALQDHLGALNDAVVTAAAVRAFLEEDHEPLAPAQTAAIAAYLADRERAIGDLQTAALVPWRAVGGATFARRLGRVAVVT